MCTSSLLKLVSAKVTIMINILWIAHTMLCAKVRESLKALNSMKYHGAASYAVSSYGDLAALLVEQQA